MPRPKRTKVAPSAPAPQLRKPAPSTPSVQNVARVSVLDDLYNISDPEEVVTSVRHVKEKKGKGKEIEQAAVTTATRRETEAPGNEEVEDRVASDQSPAIGINSALSDELDLESSPPSIEASRRERNTPMGDSRLSMANFRRRPRQPSILGRGPGRARSSSIESNMAEDNGLTSIGRRNTSALAPGSRQRIRQPSVTSHKIALVLPSSMALEMQKSTPARPGSVMDIGNFKRRVREPSILGTAQKKRQPRPLSDEEDDQDDFNPEDESTPLNLSKARVSESSPRTGELSSSNPRKRKLSAVQVPRSSPSLPSPIARPTEEVVPATLSQDNGAQDDSASNSGSLPEEAPILSIEARSVSPEPFSETMAPPQSYSPTPSSPDSPILPLPRRRASRQPTARGRRPLRGRTPPPRAQDSSPISSPPSLTHSPNRPIAATTQRRTAPPPSAFSTAQLQNLMPRRRRRAAQDPFDVPSSEDEVDASGLASDDDELSHLVARARRPVARSRTPATTRKTKGKAGPATIQAGSKRTYGSRVNAPSDKENEDLDPDDSLAPLPDNHGDEDTENSQELEKRVGLELKRAARKFAEVDKWEMEFEEVTASSSSPRDAR